MKKYFYYFPLIALFSTSCTETSSQSAVVTQSTIAVDTFKTQVPTPKDWEKFINGFTPTTLPYEVAYTTLEREEDSTSLKKYKLIDRKLAGYFLANIEGLEEAVKAYKDSTINAEFPDGDLHTFYYLHSVSKKSDLQVVTILHDYEGLPMCGSGNFRNVRLLVFDQTGKLLSTQLLGEYSTWADAPFSSVDMRNGLISNKMEISSKCTTINTEMLDEGEKNDTTVIQTQYKLLNNGTLKVVSEEKTSTIREVEGC